MAVLLRQQLCALCVSVYHVYGRASGLRFVICVCTMYIAVLLHQYLYVYVYLCEPRTQLCIWVDIGSVFYVCGCLFWSTSVCLCVSLRTTYRAVCLGRHPYVCMCLCLTCTWLCVWVDICLCLCVFLFNM